MYIDDVLIVTKRTKSEQLNEVEEVLKVLDETGVKVKAGDCTITQNSIDWLMYKLIECGISR